jgi:hypothetical protein
MFISRWNTSRCRNMYVTTCQTQNRSNTAAGVSAPKVRISGRIHSRMKIATFA